MSSRGGGDKTATAAAAAAKTTKRTHRRTRTWSFEKDPIKDSSQHRRGMSSITNNNADGPTSTTKALLVSIVAPRKFRPAVVVSDDDDDDDQSKSSVGTVATTAAEEQLLDVIAVATAPPKKKIETMDDLFDSPQQTEKGTINLQAAADGDENNNKEKLSVDGLTQVVDSKEEEGSTNVTSQQAAQGSASSAVATKKTVLPIQELFEPVKSNAAASTAGITTDAAVSDSVRSSAAGTADTDGTTTAATAQKNTGDGGGSKNAAAEDVGKPPIVPPSLPVFHQLDDVTKTVKRSNKVGSSAPSSAASSVYGDDDAAAETVGNNMDNIKVADSFLDELWKGHENISEREPTTQQTSTSVRSDTTKGDKETVAVEQKETDKAGTETKDEKDEEEEKEEVTAEEAAAVKVGEDPEDAEIDVEELLRIAFKTLLEEWHLLNVPTYSMMLDKQQPPAPIDPSMEKGDDNSSLAPAKPPKSWIHVQVMARPSSMGVIMERLERIGVGTEVGTVSFFKAELCRTASPYAHMPVKPPVVVATDSSIVDGGAANEASDRPNSVVRASTQGTTADTDDEQEQDASVRAEQERLKAEQERLKQERMLEDARNEWKNAATRLRIEQVREQIAEQAELSFDFIALLTVASILAGIGLITDNTVVIVASMLVSPLMGPVMGGTFGTRVMDWPLVKRSLLNEVLALLGCVVVGVLVGLPASFFNNLTEDWPTNEMETRGELTGLLTGIAIAIPSGMGVCLSILGGNTSSLVGVAISASLLPPAVNCGICLAYAFLLYVGALDETSEHGARGYLEIGGISLALTVVNIICIWAAGQVMFEIKEVAPTEQKNAFWATDIKAARKFNQEKPAPVNVSVLRKGVTTALSQQRQESDSKKEPVGSVRIRIPKPERNRTMFSSLDDALTFRPKAKWQQVGHSIWAAAVSEEIDNVEANEEEEDENVRYVGLEDMANLLGFHDEDDYEDAKPESTRNASRRPSRNWIF